MQNDLKIYFPFKPFYITQPWGNLNPMYAQQFNSPNFKRHNGIDAWTGKTDWQGKPTTEFPVYCPVEGFTVTNVFYEPKGGGNEIALTSDKPLQMFDKKAYARILLCHAKKVLVPIGYKPALGDLLMIADNTGFSTGLHTHMGLYRLDEQDNKLDTNEATGSFDPSLFFTKNYAVDKATLSTLIGNGMRYYGYLMSQ